ncbi:MAG TPA: response regulator [Steroidobacteraceae bacterium]|nr:response regulator [Steroidobacteraceae bacterium]
MSARPVKPLPSAGRLVCVVDADPEARRKVQVLLSALGAEARGYATAREFLATLATDVPVCVVADAHLPDLSGLELLEQVRARGLQIPTILLSTDAEIAAAVTAIRAGAIDFIEKPYIDRALVTHVAPILGLDDRHH